jgi:5-formyltetrahydrofolate cyclo-ligase
MTSEPGAGERREPAPRSSADLKRAKRTLRQEIIRVRDGLAPEERERRGALIVDRFLALPELPGARTVMAFWSFGSELPTDGLLRALLEGGWRVALPSTAGGDLEPRRYEPGAPMTAASFGAMEPQSDAVDPTEIDIVCTPGAAFDRTGRRLGYGGGFYDRFLRTTRDDTLRAGLCFSFQVVESVPAGSFDLGVDVVLTEAETIRCSR